MRVSEHPESGEGIVPLGERVIILEGKLPNSFVEKVRGLAPAALDDRRCKVDADTYRTLEDALSRYLTLPASGTLLHFAASFAFADIPAGKTFDVVFPWGNVESGVECKSILKAVIAEWAPLVMEGTSMGHRFVGAIDFPDGVPDLIAGMKDVSGFMQVTLKDEVLLCSRETWQHLKAERNI